MYLYGYEQLKQITQTERGKAYVKGLEEYYLAHYANAPILALKYSYAKYVFRA